MSSILDHFLNFCSLVGKIEGRLPLQHLDYYVLGYLDYYEWHFVPRRGVGFEEHSGEIKNLILEVVVGYDQG